ncbi:MULTISPECIES: hypothetical protein [unclassified Gordonia (in: high G+C Gram-positive bacteria)]|uniref:hypothetical protein n=1 Tax=unclassified Gordonia (in: high G+C Gram-positive bacteria) TaxID=2657482 RepID=UPI001115F307|nr:MULTISPECIES: hypothetical protein [unclassified Gordonia (in: high G+C Gram-positive bacteria)]MCX2756592.1 hypothetical protein [Gordonia sp. 4N]
MAGALAGMAVPAPVGVKATASGSAAFAATTTAAGYKIGKSVGQARVRSASKAAAAGRKVRR